MLAGRVTRAHFQTVLDASGVLSKLARFQPTIIGTPPLGIDVETSDIDIACTAVDLELFKTDVIAMFQGEPGFSICDIEGLPDPAVRAAFMVADWEVELFCQTLAIHEQWGVRHFLIEQRLLELVPALKPKVIELKQSGQKTEPAFAELLKLEGDPYAALLALEDLSDEELLAL